MYTTPFASTAAPPADHIPAFASGSIHGAPEKALARRGKPEGRPVSTATSQPAPPSMYDPKGTYRTVLSRLRFSAPRCDILPVRWNWAGPFSLIGLTVASEISSGHPARTFPLPRSRANTRQLRVASATSAAT